MGIQDLVVHSKIRSPYRYYEGAFLSWNLCINYTVVGSYKPLVNLKNESVPHLKLTSHPTLD